MNRLHHMKNMMICAATFAAVVTAAGAAERKAPAMPDFKSSARVMPLGAVRPEGWLKTQLELWRDGLTGHAEELYDDIGKSAWLGYKDGDGWERGPYYAKGLVALAFTLDDAKLKERAKRWVDAVLASQRENGDFGPKNDNWWANMPALWFVRDWGEATGDPRIVPFLMKYFDYQLARLPEHPLKADSFWAQARGGDNLEVVLWTLRRTGEKRLAKLARMIADQTSDWSGFYHDGGNGEFDDGYRMHIVNFMQGLKTPTLKWFLDGCPKGDPRATAYSAAFDSGNWAMQEHGRVDRMVNGTEPLSGRETCQGTELCATAERILSCQTVLAYGGFGSGWGGAADDLESVAYNTLPSTLGDDGRGVRYYHMLNMPGCCDWMKVGFENNGDGNAITPGPDAGFGCCRSNFHFAWPKFVQSMWMENDEGLIATAYGPCTVTSGFATIEEGGNYPFGDRVTMKIVRTNGERWTLRYRIPRWTGGPEHVRLTVNGQRQTPGDPLVREWKAGDVVEFDFGAQLEIVHGFHDSVAFRRGALVYALPLKAKIEPQKIEPVREGWPARAYWAEEPWNYVLDLGSRGTDAKIVPPKDLSGNVFAHGRAVTALKVKAYRSDYAGWGTRRPQWHFIGRAIEPPPSPVAASRLSAAAEEITLVPMGATQIRITHFPWTGRPGDVEK